MTDQLDTEFEQQLPTYEDIVVAFNDFWTSVEETLANAELQAGKELNTAANYAESVKREFETILSSTNNPIDLATALKEALPGKIGFFTDEEGFGIIKGFSEDFALVLETFIDRLIEAGFTSSFEMSYAEGVFGAETAPSTEEA